MIDDNNNNNSLNLYSAFQETQGCSTYVCGHKREKKRKEGNSHTTGSKAGRLRRLESKPEPSERSGGVEEVS